MIGTRLGLACLFVAALAGPVRAGEADQVNAATADAVQSLQQRLLADPQTAASVQALQDDPQVQAILADPAIAAALAAGDMAALLADPKIRRLAEDRAVQDLTRKLR